MKLKAYAEPLPGRGLAFVAACRAFADNLPMILRVALIMGALLLASDLRDARERLARPPAEIPPELPVAELPAAPPAQPGTPAAPALSERTRHFLNCTYEAYRREHYDACVTEPSAVYPRPPADPDDIGIALFEEPVRFASLARER